MRQLVPYDIDLTVTHEGARQEASSRSETANKSVSDPLAAKLLRLLRIRTFHSTAQ